MKKTRYQWPSILAFAGHKDIIEIKRNAKFPAEAVDERDGFGGRQRGTYR